MNFIRYKFTYLVLLRLIVCMLNKIKKVQVCDATGDAIKTTAGLKKI